MVIMLVMMQIAAAFAKAKPIIMRIASDHPVTAPHAVLFKELEKRIPEVTDGRVKFESYFGGSLYSAADALSAVQVGALEMCLGGSVLAPVSPGWSVIADLPFLFDDNDHYQRFLKTDAFKKVNKALEAKGIIHMGDWMTYGFGPVHIFNNKRPIQKLEDFKGIKMRTPPYPTLVKVIKALGMGSVVIAPPEVVTAIETGMVDGTFGHAFTIPTYNLKENCRYMTRCNITHFPAGLAFSHKWWSTLPPDLQQMLWDLFDEEGEKLDLKLKGISSRLFDEHEETPGNSATVITGAERERWREVIKPIYEELMKGEEIRMVIEAARTTR
jgi:TRAP-type C4-dicarboxylate transport system substrate-binding protein